MSTGTKRTIQDAQNDAIDLRCKFEGLFEEWMFGGSLRRRCPEVSDVEHCFRAKILSGPGTGLFAEPIQYNAVWRRLDELVESGMAVKHPYGDTGFRWGEKYRGIDFRGYLHEFYGATEFNWGPTLTIRTGPADFSQMMVVGLRRNGLRNHLGQVWRCVPCQPVKCDKTCRQCQGTGLIPVEEIPCPTEREYFELCGVPWCEPENRQ